MARYPGVISMAERIASSGNQPNRRDFVKAGVGLSAAGIAAFAAIEKVQAAQAEPAKQPLVKPGDIVLFQGDSITDAGRNKKISDANSQPALGSGYAWFAASQMLVDAPS